MTAVEEGRLAGLAVEALPVSTLELALPHLRRPFAREAVRWKVQSAGEGWGLVIAYIDARLVTERLNLVVGGEWSDAPPLGGYRSIAQGAEECVLSVFGVPRADVGSGSGPQGLKGTRSDSFKRAGVKFGIGISIYALKSVMMNATPGKDPVGDKRLVKNKERGQQGKKYWSADLSKAAETWLGDMYDKWLERRGVPLFGPVLDHGDEEGAAGMEAEGAVVPEGDGDAAGEQPQLEDDRAEELRNRVREAYGKIRRLDGAKIPPAQNRADMLEAGVSHEKLEALAVKREQQLAELEAVKAS